MTPAEAGLPATTLHNRDNGSLRFVPDPTRLPPPFQESGLRMYPGMGLRRMCEVDWMSVAFLSLVGLGLRVLPQASPQGAFAGQISFCIGNWLCLRVVFVPLVSVTKGERTT